MTILPGGIPPVRAETENSGQIIQQSGQAVPPAAPEEAKVEVKPGDYLEKIATENNTTYPRLFDANPGIKDPDLIYPGDILRVPRPDEHLARRAVPSDQPAVTAKPAPKHKSPSPAPVPSGDTSIWDRLADCESGGNWSINTGNGYYGGLQFTLSTWQGVGGSGYPHQASREEQIARGQILQARSGWGQWPACASKLGLL